MISNILIYGAGASGRITYEVLNKDKKNRLQVLGFIDDDKNKINKQIDRTKIYKPTRITNKFLADNNITVLIISIKQIILNTDILGLLISFQGMKDISYVLYVSFLQILVQDIT